MTDHTFNRGRVVLSVTNPITEDIINRTIDVLYPSIDWNNINVKETATLVVNNIRRSLNDVFRDVDQYVITPSIDVITKSIIASISKSHVIDNPDMLYFTHQAKVEMTASLQQKIIDRMLDSNFTVKTTNLHSIVENGIISHIPSHLMRMIEVVDRAIFTDRYGTYYLYKNRGTHSKTQVFITQEEFLEFTTGDRTILVIPTTKLNL